MWPEPHLGPSYTFAVLEQVVLTFRLCPAETRQQARGIETVAMPGALLLSRRNVLHPVSKQLIDVDKLATF